MEAVATLLSLILLALVVLVPIGIIKPDLKLFKKLLGDGANRKKVIKTGLLAIVVTFFGIGFTAPSNSILNSADTKTPASDIPNKLNTLNDIESERTPKIEVKEETKTESIPFTSRNQNASYLDKGVTEVIQNGVNGERKITYKVTYTDGKETKREEVDSTVTKESVEKIIAVGTYVAPAQSNSGCDSNYAGGCVPIASDVDCGGGSGNGPAYFYGTATVVGYDIYGLDRDNDDIACE